MPVYKFRTLDEASRALWAEPGDPRLGERLQQLYASADCMCPVHRPPGVRRFRSLAEAAADRATWRHSAPVAPTRR